MKRTLLSLSCALALAATPLWAVEAPPANGHAQLMATPKEDAKVGSLNGVDIRQSDLDRFQKERQSVQQRPIPANRLFDEYVNYQLLMVEAAKNKVAESAKFKAELDQFRNQLLLQHTLKQHLDSKPVTDEEINALFEKQKPTLITTEYHARHVLVPEEEQAKKLIAELDAGADIAELAKQHTTDPAGKSNGGDLGWFSAKQMVAPFSEAVAAMEPGKYSKTPVKTQFGWHIIKLEEKRQSDPKIEPLKARLEQSIQSGRLNDYIQGLIKSATIDKVPPPAPALPPAPPVPTPEPAVGDKK